MQTILGNPLASPYTLGFSAAAGFGAALAILTGFSLPLIPDFSIPLAACLGGSLAAVVVYGMARLRGMTSEVMILAGIATLFMFQSLQSLVQYMAAPEVLQEIVFWAVRQSGESDLSFGLDYRWDPAGCRPDPHPRCLETHRAQTG